MGRASRTKRERPSWARRPEAAAVVRRVEAIEQAITEREPEIWHRLGRLREEADRRRMRWPAWCWCPGAAVYGLTDDLEWSRLVTAVFAWRQGRSIYRVDPEVAGELADTELPGEIPAAKLLELPEWGLYLTGMATSPPLFGAYVHLDWSATRRRPELWIVADFAGELDAVIALPLFLDHASLADALKDAVRSLSPPAYEDGERRADGSIAEIVQVEDLADWPLPEDLDYEHLLGIVRPIVSVLLYLCSSEPDVVDPDRPGARPRRVMQAASEPRVFELGYRIATALRAARLESTRGDGHHRAPVAHLRRAHWHHYWVGPRSSEEEGPSGARRIELRWIAPVLVGGGEAETVVRELRGHRGDRS